MGASFPWENLGSFPPGEILRVFHGLGVKYRRHRWAFLYLETGKQRQYCPSSSLNL